VDRDDRPHLYRCASLIEAGIGVGGSTDAPFGPEDPWVAIRTATDRRTRGGDVLGAEEAVPARTALDGFLSHPDAPGGPPRQLDIGDVADLCLLDAPLDQALAEPSSRNVMATWVGGELLRTQM